MKTAWILNRSFVLSMLAGQAAAAQPGTFPATDAGLTGQAGGTYSYTNARIVGLSNHVLLGVSDYGNTVNRDMGNDGWFYRDGITTQVGMLGPSFVDATGWRETSVLFADANGRIAGNSQFAGTSGGNGRWGAWVWENGQLIDLTIRGTNYEEGQPSPFSQVVALVENGPVVIVARRYDPPGSSSNRPVYWAWLGQSLVLVGMLTPDYLLNGIPDGVGIVATSRSGGIAGTVSRQVGSGLQNQGAFLFLNGVSTEIGVVGPQSTSSSGARYIAPFGIADSNMVAGLSRRFLGTTDVGSDAWYSAGGVTTRLSLAGPQYATPSGRALAAIHVLTRGGRIGGQSTVYSGGTSLGPDAWEFDGEQVTRVGLYAPPFLSSSQMRYNRVVAMTDNGDVTGTAFSYLPSGAQAGSGSWLRRDGITTEIGLRTGRNRRPDGVYESGPVAILADRSVVGLSRNYVGSTAYGYTVWRSDGMDSVQVSPSTNPYLSPQGGEYSFYISTNSRSEILGATNAYAGSTNRGQSGWLWDPVSGQTTTFFAPNGAVVTPTVLTNESEVLGSYVVAAASNFQHARTRAFYWSRETGCVDLASVIEGDLASRGWANLSQVASYDSSTKTVFGHALPLSAIGADDSRVFAVRLLRRCGPSDVAGVGGTPGYDRQLTVDDVIAYLTAFFSADLNTADIVHLGGADGPDGQLTSDDIIAFLAGFFAGC